MEVSSMNASFLLGIAVAAFSLSLLALIAAIIIYVKLDVLNAIRFLRHKTVVAERSKPKEKKKAKNAIHKTAVAEPALVDNVRITQHQTEVIEPSERGTELLQEEASEQPTSLLQEESEKPTTLLQEELSEQATSLLQEEASENPTSLLEEESERPTSLLEEEETERPTSLLAEEETERPTSLLVEEETERPTGLLVEEESERPTGLLTEEESEHPTSILSESGSDDDKQSELELHTTFKFKIKKKILAVHTNETLYNEEANK